MVKVLMQIHFNLGFIFIGCHCWFDPLEKYLAKNTCACCKNDGVQCGYPKHAWCQPKVNEGIIQEGCAGERK